MSKQGNHKQSLPESLADPELEADRLSFTANSTITTT